MQSRSLKDQVYQGILNDILDGVYQPNTIINEKQLVEQYKVSKTPVREALVQLCGERVLNNIPRFGYQIAMITPSEMVEMVEYRTVIEVAALEKSFYTLTEAQLEELRALNDYARTIVKTQNPRQHWDTNEKFHKTLCSFAQNRFLQKSMEDALKTCTRIANQYFVQVWQENQEEDGNHYKLVKALEERDFDRAKGILIGDIALIKEKVL